MLQSDDNVECDPRTIEIVQNWYKQSGPRGWDQNLWVPKLSNLFSIYNRFAVRLPHRDASSVFYFYSLINHSCSPNAHAYYDPTKGLQQIHLTRDVEAGEQIFVSYNRFQALPRAERHEEIRLQGHKFVCDCTLCTSQEAEAIMQKVHFSYQSLSNFLVKIGALVGQINTSSRTPNDNKEALAIAEELVGLLQHPSIGLEGPDLKMTLHVCSLISRRLGNIKAAAMYAREELALQVRLWGFETERFLRQNDAEPWLHKIEKELSRMEAGGL
ncbi:putative tpr domain protein [Diaporthe ampelina]|uniref:Putative tpr domain protein n=1 Tax=Diaporthe ampelina TaxID=1214573 RepID=A0A0G2FGZ4_9PEZI|nr:putative tpr domain protein [Diaporthe ampelina]